MQCRWLDRSLVLVRKRSLCNESKNRDFVFFKWWCNIYKKSFANLCIFINFCIFFIIFCYASFLSIQNRSKKYLYLQKFLWFRFWISSYNYVKTHLYRLEVDGHFFKILISVYYFCIFIFQVIKTNCWTFQKDRYRVVRATFRKKLVCRGIGPRHQGEIQVPN